MIFLYVLIFLIMLPGLKILPRHGDFLGISQSTMIKGICVLLIFASHQWQYVNMLVPANWMTIGFTRIQGHLGQLIVVPFLFYSGYGIRCSIDKKGEKYLLSMPRRRIAKIYLHTIVIILLYLVMQVLLGERYTFKQIALAFLLWSDVGNSNWYIFATLFVYLSTYISFRLVKDSKKASAICFLFLALYIVLMSIWKGAFWYDTVLSYWLGLVFPDVQEKFEAWLGRGMRQWLVGIIVLSAMFLAATKVLGTNRLTYALSYNVKAVIFMLLILTVLYHISVGNRVLLWLGNHAFEIYMLQRIPMILFAKLGLAAYSVPLWLALCAVVTISLSAVCNRGLKVIDKTLFT